MVPESTISTRSDLLLQIEKAWSELQAYLAELTDAQMTDIRDDQGWNVKDHIIHMAAWEESVAYLFERRPRHEALGIDESQFANACFDEINVIVKDQRKHISLSPAMDEFRRVHGELIATVQRLSDADLNEPVARFFPQAPRNDDRRVLDLIYDNTAHHFEEHLPWIKALPASRG